MGFKNDLFGLFFSFCRKIIFKCTVNNLLNCGILLPSKLFGAFFKMRFDPKCGADKLHTVHNSIYMTICQILKLKVLKTFNTVHSSVMLFGNNSQKMKDRNKWK